MKWFLVYIVITVNMTTGTDSNWISKDTTVLYVHKTQQECEDHIKALFPRDNWNELERSMYEDKRKLACVIGEVI